MIKAIFFDIDDTLYDSTRLAKMARRNSIKAMIDAGLPIRDEDEAYDILEGLIERFGSNYPHHYDELLKAVGLEWDPKIIAAGAIAYEHTKVGYLKPFPQVVPTLLKLKERFALGVISNGLAIKQWEKLVGLGLHHFFDVVVTSEEIGHEKPEREIFEFGIKKLGAKPEECLMVGDRPETDIAGAKKAGMRTLLLLRGKSRKTKSSEKPDFEIEAHSEIFKVLDKVGGR